MSAKLSTKNVTDAMRATSGVVSEAARSLGVSRGGLQKWLAKHPDVRALTNEYRDALVDMAEAELATKVKDGDMVAIAFTLKTLGRSRGYIERIPDVVASANLDALRRILLRFGLTDVTDEQLLLVSHEVKAEIEAERA